MLPLVSIIINNYNYDRFLQDAINSALNQTYKNIEVIVVDDGSDDGSLEIIESYNDRIIPVFKENGGQGSAYNAGFLKSRGELICNLDSDDILLDYAIEIAIVHFDKEKVIKVQWPLMIVNALGNDTNEITTKWTPPDGDLKEMVLQNGPFYDFHLTMGSLLKRTFLLDVLPMPEKPYKNGGDVYLITLAPIFGHICNVMEPLGTYRFHGANNYVGQTLDDNRILNYIDRFESNSDMLEKFALQLGYKPDRELWRISNFNYLWPIRLLKAKEDIKQVISEGSSYILINGNEWCEGEPVPKRHAIPFTEINGEYGGLPEDDEAAIQELERLRTGGAQFLVFWWTSFWWFEHYEIFFQYLQLNFKWILKNERVKIFELESAGKKEVLLTE